MVDNNLAAVGRGVSSVIPATSPSRRDLLTSLMRDYLSSLRRTPILYFPTPGNAGDSLIQAGTYQAFRRAGIPFRPIDEKTEIRNKILIIGGGANLVPLYREVRDFLLGKSAIEAVEQLIILPHTIRGNEDLLAKMDARVTIFCRDVKSYEHVSTHAKTANVFIEHDMALHLDTEVFYEDCRSLTDVGSLFTSTLAKLNLSIAESDQALPANFFRDDGERREEQPIPEGNIDLSRTFEFGTWPTNAEKATWCLFEAIRRSALVRTDRLHVGIACALLGVTCEMHDNNYGKNSQIFWHSIRKFCGCVHLV